MSDVFFPCFILIPLLSSNNYNLHQTYVAIENGLEETDDDDLEENKTVVSPRKNEEGTKDDNDVELTTIILNNRLKSEVSTTDSETTLNNDSEEEMETILNEEAFETLNELDTSNSCVVCAKKMFSFLDPLTFEVAIYAIMFGTDNIAIYVALFSSVSLLETLGVSLFFYSLLFLYLIVAIIIIVKVCITVQGGFLFSHIVCIIHICIYVLITKEC